jgi:Do/DeqQ family serine protease
MNSPRLHLSDRARGAALAALAVALCLGGGAWLEISAATGSKPVVASEQPHVAAPATPAVPSRAAIAGRESYADLVKVVAPAVVTIRTEGRVRASQTNLPDDDFFRRFFGEPRGADPRAPRSFRQRGLGSGVIVSSDGFILTNHHVVDGADQVRVDLSDGRVFTAKVVGTDAPSDLALVKIEANSLRPLALGNSDEVQVGDVVLAIGNPLGIGQTVTMGIVGAKGRSTGVGDGSYEDFLQTDAPINQGNSGGALVNMKGELIGINAQILSPSGGNIGIGFAIPAKMANHVMTLLRTEGRVRRAQLGVTVQPVTADMAQSLRLKDVSGAIVSSVTPGSAAERAGIKRGDIIVSFNGEPAADANTLRNRIAEAAPGSRATIVINRESATRELSVTLGEAESKAARADRRSDDDAAGQAALGVYVEPLTPEVANQLGLPRQTRGLVVQDVQDDSRAADAGIRPGDVIQEVNRQPVQNVEEFRAAIQQSADRPVLLLVNREGNEIFVTAGRS